MKVVPMLR